MLPTELPNANTTSQTDMSVQENLLRYYEQNFAELPEDQKLTKLCSDAGFLKDNGKGQCFIALEEEEGPEDMQTFCREYTLPQGQEASRAIGWIRGNTKIGTVLDVKVYCHQGRYCIDIMIEYLFRDRTVSWVRVVNGINKYVTETSEEILAESAELVSHDQKLAVTLSPDSIQQIVELLIPPIVEQIVEVGLVPQERVQRVDEHMVEVLVPAISEDKEQIVDVPQMREGPAKLAEDTTVPLDKEKTAEVRQLVQSASNNYATLGCIQRSQVRHHYGTKAITPHQVITHRFPGVVSWP